MIPATYNLPDAYRGDSYGPVLLRVKDSEGNYISFVGGEINLHVKNKKNCAVVLSWSTSDGTVETPDDYSIILKEKIGCRMGMPPGVYVYDLQILINKVMKSYLKGSLSVVGDITDIVFCDCEYNGGSAIGLQNSCDSLIESAFSVARI
jgi:hypothetical protein